MVQRLRTHFPCAGDCPSASEEVAPDVREASGAALIDVVRTDVKRDIGKAKLRAGRTGASAPNDVWAMDFVHDQLFDGRKIRALTIVDIFTRHHRRDRRWRGYDV